MVVVVVGDAVRLGVVGVDDDRVVEDDFGDNVGDNTMRR